MMSTGKKKNQSATRSGDSEKDGVGGAETKAKRVEVDKEKVAVISEDVEKKNVKGGGTEKTEEMGTEKSKEVCKKREEVKAEVKEEDTVDTSLMGPRAAYPEAGPEVKVFRSARKIYRLIQDTLFKDLKNEKELETGSAFTVKVSFVLVDFRNKIRSAPAQWTTAHEFFSKRGMEGAVRVVCSVMALGAHGHIFRSSLVFHR